MSAAARLGERDRTRIWFRAISDHVYAYSGIHLHEENRGIYERKVDTLRRDLGAPTMRDYYLRLRHHPAGRQMTQDLVETITTGETYFFRESGQLRFFFDRIAEDLTTAAGPGRPLCIWSVGCSTGEEPYSLAILAREHGLEADEVEIVGGDISQRALTRAREGVYRESAFRAAPLEWKGRYFSELGDGRWRIRDDVRSLVEFVSLNLMEPDGLSVLPRPDVVFCRNVLIYFDREAKTRAIDHLHDRIRPGGVLMLGHAESLLHLRHRFHLERIGGELVYRRPEAADGGEVMT